jgi:hypothetical protein
MKRLVRSAIIITLSVFAILLAGVFGSGCSRGSDQSKGLDELYRQVDMEIEKSKVYMADKERRIDGLRKRLGAEKDTERRLRIYDNLIAEYESYISDSALYYASEAQKLAEQMGNVREERRLQIKKADVASHAGLFTEAHEMLGAVPRTSLDSLLLANYYATYSSLYQYECEYLPEGEYSARSSQLRNIYIDSLMSVSDPESFEYLSNWAAPEITKGNYGEVKKRLEENLLKYEPGTRQYSILASIMAFMYQQMGNEDEQKRYLSMTVISDIQGAVKENMAIRELATQVFEDGDIDRANHYLKVSFDDANFFAARMRNAQSSRMLPVIDKAYDTRQKEQQTRQRIMLYIISGLLLVVIIGVVFILKQVKRVQEANRRVNKSNEELSAMSEKLREMNGTLEETNEALKKSNHTTEEYAGLFMEFCSLNISSLQKYHLALRNLAVQGNVKGILKKLDSGDVTADALKVFYSKFDEAILNIYSSFVEKVNALLLPDGQIVLKSGERLNTELRVLALIRIGITDSEKISQFLRCSISTIYTYRSKLKRRALNPEGFENEVMEI